MEFWNGEMHTKNKVVTDRIPTQRLLLSGSSIMNIINWTVKEEYYKVLRALLKLKNVDTEIYDRVGWTPIMYAARHDEADCVALLLEHPANANATTTTGKTALILSSERGHYSCVKLLCEYSGTNLYHKDKTFNMNALEWAQKKGRRAVVNYLKMVFAGESEKQGDDNRGNGLWA